MDFKVLADLIENGLPFQKMLGIRVASIEESCVRLFGGVISTLAAVCDGFAVPDASLMTASPPSPGSVSGVMWPASKAPHPRACASIKVNTAGALR